MAMRCRVLVFLAVVAALPAGCALGTHTQSSGRGVSHNRSPQSGDSVPLDSLQVVRLTTYSGNGISFSYPASWRYHRRGFSSQMSSPVVDLATQPTRNPCVAHRCWFPVRHLRRGGVVVMWNTGAGMIDPAHPPGPGIHVRVLRWGCRALGGAEELIARVVLRTGRVYEAAACLRGPGTPVQESEVRAMFESARAAR
jgi:hypothetical protein